MNFLIINFEYSCLFVIQFLALQLIKVRDVVSHLRCLQVNISRIIFVFIGD